MTSIRPRRAAAAVSGALMLSLFAACGNGGFSSDSNTPSQASGPANLKVLVAANAGSTDLQILQDAAKAWADKTGNKIDVQPASNMTQQLSQGFASGNPPDAFWVDASMFPTYAKAGYLYPFGDQMGDVKFYDALNKSFTYDNKLYCAPKDFSTLGLVINTDMWKAAGLTEADYPKTWDQLETVAKKLTKGKVKGLVVGDTRDRVGAFMREAGGWFTNADQTQMTADSDANVQALTYVQKLLKEGVAAYPKEVSSGWGGEAIGKGVAAMTIEGNWVKQALTKDYPNIHWRVLEMPSGPAGKGTLTFTQCWSVAAQSKQQAAAVDFVKSLYTVDTQLKFAKQFGVMPSIESARQQYDASVPDAEKAWLSGADYAQGPVSAPNMDPVMKDFDTKLQSLKTTDPKTILAATQKNGEAVLKGNG